MAGKPRVAIVGGGVVGSALGRACVGAGYPVVLVASRTRASAARAAAFIAGGNGEAATGAGARPAVTTHAERAPAVADLVLVAVPDRALAEVATTLAGATDLVEGVCVAHCAGAWPADVLAPVAARGAAIGGLHPLQAFATAADACAAIAHTVFGIEGDAAVQARLTALVRDLGATPLPIAAGAKACYHAAGVIASNYLVVLVSAAVTCLERAGADRATALAALGPLLRGTVANLERVGLPGALTGPIARGDVPTVQAHLEALAAAAPEWLPLYAVCGRFAVGLGQAKGTLADDAADVLRTLLARRET